MWLFLLPHQYAFSYFPCFLAMVYLSAACVMIPFLYFALPKRKLGNFNAVIFPLLYVCLNLDQIASVYSSDFSSCLPPIFIYYRMVLPCLHPVEKHVCLQTVYTVSSILRFMRSVVPVIHKRTQSIPKYRQPFKFKNLLVVGKDCARQRRKSAFWKAQWPGVRFSQLSPLDRSSQVGEQWP